MEFLAYIILLLFGFIGLGLILEGPDEIKGILLYIWVVILTGAFIWTQSYFKVPEYDSCDEFNTPMGVVYCFSHSRYQCPSENFFYCVQKKSNTVPPCRKDKCIYCGKPFFKHVYQKTEEEEELIDAITQAFLETPAE